MPAGHGDLYPAMLGSGTLDRLLKNFRYMFVSNSDNLGATMDLKLLSWFAASGARLPWACRRAGRLQGRPPRPGQGQRAAAAREAQCPKEDEEAFGDWTKHRFFNTNNLWVDLQALKATFESLPNKTLPLRDEERQDGRPARRDVAQVLQLETAMGAAIECFDGAQAIVVPRERFAPSRQPTTSLRSLRTRTR